MARRVEPRALHPTAIHSEEDPTMTPWTIEARPQPYARLAGLIYLFIIVFGGYTNGWEGYVPNAEDFRSSGYEVEWATPYAATTAAVLVREARRLAADLAQARP